MECCTVIDARDHRERLVGHEHPVPASEQIALEPALAEMLAQHLHHSAVGGDVIVDRRGVGSTKQRFSTSNTLAEPIRVRLVGTEEPEIASSRVRDEHVAQHLAELPRRFARHGRRLSERRRRIRGSRERRAAASDRPPFACGLAPMRRVAAAARARRAPASACHRRRTAFRARSCAASSRASRAASGFVRAVRQAEPDARGTCLRPDGRRRRPGPSILSAFAARSPATADARRSRSRRCARLALDRSECARSTRRALAASA